MVDYRQSQRVIRLKTSLPEDHLLPVAVEGYEAVSSPFRFDVEFWVPRGVDLSYDTLLDRSATLTLAPSQDHPRFVHGIVDSVKQIGWDERFHKYVARMVPSFSLLKNTVRSRVFQDMSVPEILREVLKGMHVREELSETYLPHDHCFQYESDFDFASRLMEEQGIYYLFRHTRDKHELVLSDKSIHAGEIHGQPSVAYARDQRLVRSEWTINRFRKRQALRSASVTVRDYHFQRPDDSLESRHTSNSTVAVGKQRHRLDLNVGDLYEPWGNFANRFDETNVGGGTRPDGLSSLTQESQRIARIRSEEEAAQSLLISGASDHVHLLPGHRFELTKHPHADDSYFLVEVRHRLRAESYIADGPDRDEAYANTFEGIPARVPYRPRRLTPIPTIAAQPALVVGPPGEEIFVDKYGRIKVQFYWDRDGKLDPRSSCWLRVLNSMAGSGYGSYVSPRVGQEVLVEFLYGDCDHPVALGGLYNSEQTQPFSTPFNRTQLGIRSQTVGGDKDRFSGLAFEDSQGVELVHTHASKNMIYSATGNHHINTGQGHYENHGTGRNAIVGGFFGLTDMSVPTQKKGSGGGSGDDFEEHDSAGEWNTGSEGTIAADMDLVYGVKLQTALGLYFEPILGIHLCTVFNPIGLFSAVFSPLVKEASAAALAAGPLPFLAGWSFPLTGQGNCFGHCATSTTMVYGAAYKLYRGPYVEGKYDKISEATTLTKVAAGLYFTAAVTFPFILAALPQVNSDSHGWQWQDYVDVLVMGLLMVLYNLWFTAETTQWYIDHNAANLVTWSIIWTKLCTAAAAAGAAAGTFLYEGLVLMGENYGAMGQAMMMGGIPMGATSIVEDAELSALTVEGVPSMDSTDGNIAISSPGFQFVSDPDITDVMNLISLTACGIDDLGGIIGVQGNQAVNMQAGELVNVGLFAETEVGTITIDAGEGGTTRICSGPEELPMITVNPTGIEWISLTEISLTCDTSELSLNAASIIFESGGSNIEVTPAAININAPALNVTADAEIFRVTPEMSVTGADHNQVYVEHEAE
ncbi:Phage-related baseplate assembly protein [Planctomycetes bacterium Pan216]|uniref:Phage-related baseplate assembly protein n=1 Tax=Kolteria novifilia TaxID=2527975 RepID=A0A518AY58_9BACT|nr:Phage-related baseplate assembly protein [Planctomycetes bacterium Pan216]